MKHFEGYILNMNKPKEVIMKGKMIASENMFCSTFPKDISTKLYKNIETAMIMLCPTSKPFIPA